MRKGHRENLAKCELLAFEALYQKGLGPVEIREQLGISLRTYYRRLEELRKTRPLEKAR